MHLVPVVPAPCFRDIPIGIGKVPLATAVAGVVAWYRGGKLAEHGEEPTANIVNTDISAEAQLLDLELLGTELLGGPTHGVVFGMVEVKDVVDVRAELRHKVFRCHGRVYDAAICIQPRPVAFAERRCLGGLL